MECAGSRYTAKLRLLKLPSCGYKVPLRAAPGCLSERFLKMRSRGYVTHVGLRYMQTDIRFRTTARVTLEPENHPPLGCIS